ncbi:MAG: hypothetical protein ACMUIE_00725 [Thermoplasmatota archaeon]
MDREQYQKKKKEMTGEQFVYESVIKETSSTDKVNNKPVLSISSLIISIGIFVSLIIMALAAISVPTNLLGSVSIPSSFYLLFGLNCFLLLVMWIIGIHLTIDGAKKETYVLAIVLSSIFLSLDCFLGLLVLVFLGQM